jgi:hypothetical protein
MGAHLKLNASDGHKFGAYRVDPAQIAWGRTLRFIDSHM